MIRWSGELVGGVHHGKLSLCQFGGHRYLGSSDMSFFHLRRDHVIKRFRNIEVGAPPPQIITLPSLVAIVIAEV